MQIFHTDGGGEFTSRKFQEYISQKRVRHEITTPYLPEKNGFFEQDNLWVMESVWSFLHSSGYPLSLWAKFVSNHLHSKSHWSRLIPRNTLSSHWYGFKPSLEHLRILGCQATSQQLRPHESTWWKYERLPAALGLCDLQSIASSQRHFLRTYSFWHLGHAASHLLFSCHSIGQHCFFHQCFYSSRWSPYSSTITFYISFFFFLFSSRSYPNQWYYSCRDSS